MNKDDLLAALSTGADFSQFSKDDLVHGLNDLTAQIAGAETQAQVLHDQLKGMIGIIGGRAKKPVIICPNPKCRQRIEFDPSILS